MKYYVIAVFLLGYAAVTEWGVRIMEARINVIVAQSVTQHAESDPNNANVEQLGSARSRILARATVVHLLGLAVCGGGIVAWAVSRRRKEKGSQVLPIVLLAAYVLSFLMMV